MWDKDSSIFITITSRDADAIEPSAAQGARQTLGCSPLSRHRIAKRVAPFDMIGFVLSLLTTVHVPLFLFLLDVGTSVGASRTTLFRGTRNKRKPGSNQADGI